MGKIKEVRRMLNGHLGIEFEDGTQVVVPRGEHEDLQLKPGDEYPPVVESRITDEGLEVTREVLEEEEFEELDEADERIENSQMESAEYAEELFKSKQVKKPKVKAAKKK